MSGVSDFARVLTVLTFYGFGPLACNGSPVAEPDRGTREGWAEGSVAT